MAAGTADASRLVVNSAESATTTTLLGLALVLLGGSLVVTQALEVSKDPGLGHLTLETAQGRLDAFVFADGDLGHVLSKGSADGRW